MSDEFDPKDHWEVLFNQNYLRWFHLMGKEATVEIERVEKDVELTMPGGTKDKRGVVHFKGKDKPLVLNKTNARMIASIHGNKPSLWPGKKVILYPTQTPMWNADTKQMEKIGCIRVKSVQSNSSSTSAKPKAS